ncbi:small ubiquitin-related modifier [Anaeramoeba flamelloides]|uniref:Small ubiquitin-related modifier n=1 Tax=Anaeramoeba flamelloides TaxID=1746091 RepID=A0ABQ8Z8D5_9EUKA|nr:small ubiquitin-related modifier [Anaeramoeba flamelloides]
MSVNEIEDIWSISNLRNNAKKRRKNKKKKKRKKKQALSQPLTETNKEGEEGEGVEEKEDLTRKRKSKTKNDQTKEKKKNKQKKRKKKKKKKKKKRIEKHSQPTHNTKNQKKMNNDLDLNTPMAPLVRSHTISLPQIISEKKKRRVLTDTVRATASNSTQGSNLDISLSFEEIMERNNLLVSEPKKPQELARTKTWSYSTHNPYSLNGGIQTILDEEDDSEDSDLDKNDSLTTNPELITSYALYKESKESIEQIFSVQQNDEESENEIIVNQDNTEEKEQETEKEKEKEKEIHFHQQQPQQNIDHNQSFNSNNFNQNQNSQRILIKFINEKGNDLFIQTKTNSPLSMSFSRYIKKMAPEGTLKFIFDGEQLSGEETPEDLDMEDQDQIEVSNG